MHSCIFCIAIFMLNWKCVCCILYKTRMKYNLICMMENHQCEKLQGNLQIAFYRMFFLSGLDYIVSVHYYSKPNKAKEVVYAEAICLKGVCHKDFRLSLYNI